MSSSLSIVFLWLLVINLGVVVGAGFYELRVVVPVWGKSPPQSLKSPESGLSFWVFVTNGSLSFLVIANLLAVVGAPEPARTWWLIAIMIVAAERIVTLAYFSPTMTGLQSDHGRLPNEARAAFTRWVTLSYPRNAACFAAWLAAMKALVIAV
jgi:hypothetical protein